MKTYLALLRGINVGGHHKLKMTDLKSWIKDLEITQVKTHLQSGNLLFCSELSPLEMQTQISAILDQQLDFQVPILVLTHAQVKKALADCPYHSEAQAEPKSVHFCFLASPPETEHLALLEGLCRDGESFTLTDQVLHLHYPEGSGRSRLALPAIEKNLKCWGTARNWNSLSKIEELMASESANLKQKA